MFNLCLKSFTHFSISGHIFLKLFLKWYVISQFVHQAMPSFLTALGKTQRSENILDTITLCAPHIIEHYILKMISAQFVSQEHPS